MNAQPTSSLDRAPQVNVSSYIRGTGMSVPDRVIPNSYFESYLETNDQWIRERTGIIERRWAEPTMSMSDLALPACERAIASAGLTAADIDGIVVATVTPDYVFPSTACVLQKKLGIRGSLAFDVNAVCSGFVYALVTAEGLVRSGAATNMLVVGADMFSRLIDPNDRTTAILFGDGAGAMVLSAAGESNTAPTGGPRVPVIGSPRTTRGIYGSQLHADGSHGDLLCVPGGTAAPVTPESLRDNKHYLTMNGREIFKLAVRGLAEVSDSLLKRHGMEVGDVDHYISHQANARILTAVAKQLGLPVEKLALNVEKYGNTSAARVPLLLAECVSTGRVQQGDLVLISAFGAGLTWGAVLVRM
ncbi:MAG: ketoacyl-ACP synthase III [Deltaproteobacteria bacterium]|nr:ketoacyl-ACP synthase III [Deltaproteobacteria bacterium]